MRRVRQSLVLQHKCRVSCVLALGENRQDRGRRPDAGSEDLAPAFSAGLGRVRPAAAAALAALAVEIAKQEAQTVHKGGQTGNQNAAKDKDKTNVRNTDNRSSTRDKESVTGLLRRLAKQGRDDLLERVAIAKAIEEEIGNRQGKRTDLELPGDCPEVDGNETRAIAAEKAGFGSVVAVVENHT